MSIIAKLKVISLAFFIVLGAGAAYIATPPDIGRLAETSTVVRASNGDILELRLTPSGHWRESITLDAIDPLLIDMLVAYEDQRFWTHHGVDVRALARALGSLLTTGRITSGASTLTMQTVRLIDPNLGRRSLWVKVRQMFAAIRLDAHLSKTEILEAYFTLAPYGGNIEGVKAASAAWFEKPPEQLTMSEAALLVALPQSPERRRPDRHPEQAFEAKARVLNVIHERLGIGDEDLLEYKSEALPGRKYVPQANAPHLADRLRVDDLNGETSISSEWQGVLSKVVSGYAEQFEAPINAAAMVVERRSGFIRAYVGSADYLSKERKGGINYLTATRSPGSTLKPFIYAKALQRGLISPNEIFSDAPIQVSGYAPGNFNSEFSGDVTLREALVRSLNIPAVETLGMVGVTDFEASLSSFLGRSNTATSGLSLAVGGFYMTAEELTELYLEFADPDEANGLRFFEGEELRKRPYLFEARSVNTVQNLLLQEDRSGNVTLFKTGTSHNRQDAWTIALTKNHIVLAWLGTPDVEPTEILTGRSAAYPLARLIIEAMGLEAPVKRTDVIEDDGDLLKLKACPKLIQFPEDGEWIKSDNLSVSVSGKTGNEWFLNGSPIELGNGAIDLSAPGVQRLTAKNGDCSETVQIFVEIAH